MAVRFLLRTFGGAIGHSSEAMARRGRCCTRLAETLVTAAELAVFDVGNLAWAQSSQVESSRVVEGR